MKIGKTRAAHQRLMLKGKRKPLRALPWPSTLRPIRYRATSLKGTGATSFSKSQDGLADAIPSEETFTSKDDSQNNNSSQRAVKNIFWQGASSLELGGSLVI
jgi:hypothetical protein